MYKKILSLVLLAGMLLSAAACGGDTQTQDTTAPAGVDTTAPEETEATRENTPDSLPTDLNFDGTTLNIYHFGSDDATNYDAVGEMGGDIVLDAVYQRNLITEERLNVKLNWIAGANDWDQHPTNIQNAMLSGASDWDIVMEENSRAFQHSIRGYFFDLMDVNYIDLDQPWWYSDLMEQGSIDNTKRYSVTGDITPTTLFGASAMFFNKAIFNDHFGDVAALYDHVLNGTWTYDVFAQYCRDVYTDVNGDSTANAGDLFGFMYEQWGVPNHMSMSTGLPYITRDSEGLPVLDVYNEQTLQWGETLYKLLYTDNISIQGTKVEAFLNGQTLFLPVQLGTATQLRESEFEYGILPYPKLTETLDYMSAAATANGEGVAIPVTTPTEKLDACAATIELLCAEAYRRVVPAWYDTALKIKYIETEIDAQMVDIIYDHIASPFIMIADKEIGIGSLFTNAIFGANNDGAFASYYATNESSFQAKWDKMIKDYKNVEN